MALFRSASDRLRGTVASSLQERVALDIDRRVQLVLERSVVLWEQANWKRFDDLEENCTVQIYRWCREAIRLDNRLCLLALHLEWINTTPAILAGDESVKSARRPDLRIEVGQVGRAIECKRLAATGGWTRKYVHDGLARFVVGDYGHLEAVGYMVGYIQTGARPTVVAGINKHIAAHPSMGVSHELKPIRDNGNLAWGRSNHPRPAGQSVEVEHLFVSMV